MEAHNNNLVRREGYGCTLIMCELQMYMSHVHALDLGISAWRQVARNFIKL